MFNVLKKSENSGMGDVHSEIISQRPLFFEWGAAFCVSSESILTANQFSFDKHTQQLCKNKMKLLSKVNI